MGATYTVDVKLRLVRSRAWGVLTTADVQGLYGRMMADERIAPGFRQLADWRSVTSMQVSQSAVAEAAHLRLFDAHMRRAIVVASDVAFGIARMFAAHAEESGQDVQIFRDMATAEIWLDSSA